MIEEFKKFIMRGNVVDMAVGIVIGAAFGTIIKSLVADVIMPPVGMLLGGVDFSNIFMVLQEGDEPGPYSTLVLAQESGAITINWGMFLNTLVSFIIVAFAIFMLVKAVNKMNEKPEPEEAVADPEPGAEEKLLIEIRDLLKNRE